MAKTIDYYLSLVSPYTYMGGPRLDAIARRQGARITYQPVDFGRIFAATGGLPVAQRPPARLAYRMMELKRWRDGLRLPMHLEPKYFPVPDWPAAGMVVAARLGGLDCGDLSNAILRAVWEEERDVSDAETLIAIADAIGLAGRDLYATATTSAIREVYDADTEEALARGVFGAPTYVYQNELFWGQDRLEFLEQAMTGK